MNDQLRWDPSLIKKFSSSNHFKLLNQLRNEVKKYPLNNKKNTTSVQATTISQDNKNKSNSEQSKSGKNYTKSNKIADENVNNFNVSFNNSKNFSIYKQTNNTKNINHHKDSYLPDVSNSNDETVSASFKDRLNQIDMK